MGMVPQIVARLRSLQYPGAVLVPSLWRTPDCRLMAGANRPITPWGFGTVTIMTVTTRPRGFADWSPSSDTMAIVDMIIAVLENYAEYLPLTLRQIF